MGFKFKQFSIDDSDCGQKVGTDSIMLGSWSEPGAAKTILDIGTGSGLLLLMQAQKAHSGTTLIGIDLDAKSVEVARKNISNSPWQHLEVIQKDIRHFLPAIEFDLIISNPPYFDHHAGLITQHQTARYNARHNQYLGLDELIDCAKRLLSDKGVFRAIIPFEKREWFANTARAKQMFVSKTCYVHSYDTSNANRVMVELGKIEQPENVEKLIIYQDNNEYTRQFKMLCKAYYLRF